MRLKTILLILFCLTTKHIFAKDFYVRELRDNSGKKIFYIDMIHIGTRSYYKEVYENLKNILHSNKNAIILREKYDNCSQVDLFYKINTDSLYKPKIPLDHGIEYYKNNNLPFIQDMIANEFLEQYRCREEATSAEFLEDKKTYNQQKYMSYVNDTVIYQEDYFNEKIPKIKEDKEFYILNNVFSDFSNATIDADVVLSREPIFYKFLNDFVNLDYDLKKKLFSNEDIDKLTKLEDIWSIENRNDYMLLNIFNTFYTKNTDTIVLPWGRLHYPNLAQKLKEKGFKEIKKYKLKFFECDELRDEKILDFLIKFEFGSDIVLQCGSAFDAKGEVLGKFNDEEENITATVTIYPSFLEITNDSDVNNAADNFPKFLKMQIYKDGNAKVFQLEEDKKIHIHLFDEHDNKIGESVDN